MEQFIIKMFPSVYFLAKHINNYIKLLKRYIRRNKIIAKLFGGGFLLDSHHSIVKLKEDVRGKDNALIVDKHCLIDNMKLLIVGNNNNIKIGANCKFVNVDILIKGCNCQIIIGENCNIGEKNSFWLEGDGVTIKMGHSCTMTNSNQIVAAEKNSSVVLGDDVMMSNHVIVRTTDAHPIYDSNGIRINIAKDVFIGNHVWIAPDTKIMKGAIINDGSIIGSNTMVTKTVPSNCLAVGCPARVVKENIHWTRENIYKS